MTDGVQVGDGTPYNHQGMELLFVDQIYSIHVIHELTLDVYVGINDCRRTWAKWRQLLPMRLDRLELWDGAEGRNQSMLTAWGVQIEVMTEEPSPRDLDSGLKFFHHLVFSCQNFKVHPARNSIVEVE